MTPYAGFKNNQFKGELFVKKQFSLIAATVMIWMFATAAFAAPNPNPGEYYDVNGYIVYGNDYYYSDDGVPMFGGYCYYMDGNRRVRVQDQQVYVRDEKGNIVAAQHLYDANGNPITPANLSAYGYYNCYWGNQGPRTNGGGWRGGGCCHW